jgi:uncharacterized protein involved in propanediol utilization
MYDNMKAFKVALKSFCGKTNPLVNTLNTHVHKISTSRVNGTFGELLQGYLPNGRSFMVTNPIHLYSNVTFIPDPNSKIVTVAPEHKKKSQILVNQIIKTFNLNIGGKLIIQSEIPESKGLASSSADLVATAYAISNSLGLKISKELISKLISCIEPSDGVMYDEIVSFYYKELELIEKIGKISNLAAVALDEGGNIDTIEYNKKKFTYRKDYAELYSAMLDRITKAIKSNDLETIGKIATQSALMNQKNNHKKHLNSIIEICNDIGGLGVSIAHSGTFVGILLNTNSPEFTKQKDYCMNKMKKLNNNFSIFFSR